MAVPVTTVPSRLQVTSATFPHQQGKPSRPNWGNWMELNRTSQGSQQLGGALKRGNQLLLYTCLHWFVLIMIDVLDVWAGLETFVDWLHWLVQCGFSPWDCDDPDKARLHYTHHSTSQALGHCKSLLQISCQLVSFLQGPFKCRTGFSHSCKNVPWCHCSAEIMIAAACCKSQILLCFFWFI